MVKKTSTVDKSRTLKSVTGKTNGKKKGSANRSKSDVEHKSSASLAKLLPTSNVGSSCVEPDLVKEVVTETLQE